MEAINDINVVFFCILFFCLGWKARELWALRQIKDLISDLEDTEDDRIHITVDITANGIFVYEKDTLKYLAHGNSEHDITNILKQRFPGKTFAASSEDMLKLLSSTK